MSTLTRESDDPAPVPTSASAPDLQRLTDARKAAVDLITEAEELESKARDARRRARARLKHYERLLSEYQGQMSVLDEEGVM